MQLGLRYLQEMPKENLVAKLDFRNAFNSLMRNQMLDAIARVAPEIYSFCYSAYSVNYILSFVDHEVVSSEGPQQGDPLGPLMFSITIQPILDKLNNELVIGYLDGITLGGGFIKLLRILKLSWRMQRRWVSSWMQINVNWYRSNPKISRQSQRLTTTNSSSRTMPFY